MEETAFFRRRRVVFERLPAYGFAETEGEYRLSEDILDGQFCLSVSISAQGRVDTRLTDTATGEEYVLHRVPGAVGAFTGAVRTAYERALSDIAAGCFETDIFRSGQARELIAYVRDAYGDEPEYLWERFPDNAIWRRRDNQKWYGALLSVSRRKLGLPSDELAEIIDLRIEPERLAGLVDNRSFFPGWHMNKKNWYTIILDGSVPTDRLKLGIDESYALAAKK